MIREAAETEKEFETMKKLVLFACAVVLMLPVGLGWAYDSGLAASYADLFAPVQGAKAGKALHLMSVNAFVEQVKQGKPVVALDVRTPAESGIFSVALPNSLRIPVNELFKAENLEQLPTDTRIVVLCKSGTRATAVGTALRHVGFENVYILKGGFKALAAYLDAKTSNQTSKKVAMQ
jgi:rhodanese-related sulfurtransferase